MESPRDSKPRTAKFEPIFGPRLKGEAQTLDRGRLKEQRFEPRL